MRRSIKSLLSLVTALAAAMVARPAVATVEAQLYADTYVVTSGSGASMRVYSVLDIYAKGNHIGDSIAGSVLGITS